MAVIAAHRASHNALVQVVRDEDLSDLGIYWVQVRDAAQRVVELHERGTEQAARELANARWSHYRKV